MCRVLRIELSIVLTGTDPETSSQIGFTMYIEGTSEWTRKSIANWLSQSRARPENIRCVMGYIVNLIVILDGIFRAVSGNGMENTAQEVMGDHVRSGRRDSIHRDIRKFVTDTFPNRFNTPQDILQKDLVLEKIIDLIWQYCASP